MANSQLQWADRLLTGLTGDYEINYADESGELFTCTYHPGDTLADCSVDGWPDEPELQRIVADKLLVAVAEDDDDRHLALSPDERRAVEALSCVTLAERRFDELTEEWGIEDEAEDQADDDSERKRDAWQEVQRLAGCPALCRTPYAAPLNLIARSGIDAIEDIPAVETLLMQATGALLMPL